MDAGTSAPQDDRPRPQPMTLVRWRSGKLHITADGITTVCGSAVTQDRATIVHETTDWPEQVNCYNCAYRHTPPGYLPPRSGRDFPLKKECPNHPGRGLAAGSCHLCDPSTLRPQNWPCPNGCTDPLDHNPLNRYTRCTVFPPSRESGPGGRCVDGCESTERAMRRANPKLWFTLADNAMTTCYHCGQSVCISCQQVPVDTDLAVCDQCGDYESATHYGSHPLQTSTSQTRASTNTAMSPTSVPEHEPAPRRAKEKWSESEHDQLIVMLRDGLPLEDIAAQLGRGVDAVASRCQRLLPPNHRASRGKADLVLRAYLAGDPDYDWRAGLREEANRRGRFYWDSAADTFLRDGWERARPMAELLTATGASELEVAARLVELDIAGNTIEVAGRLGCEPGATLDVRVRMAADHAAAAVWVLVADGLRGTERATPLDREDVPKAYRHVSLHARPEDARQTLDRLLADHTDRGGSTEEVSVTLAQRTVGDLAIGDTHHEHAPQLSTPT
jgi:ribosome-binding protein aMBF1 (putative translation factor)